MEVLGVALENILIGVLAALFAGLLVRGKDFAYNKYLERQYPVAGEYITSFEYKIEDEEITITAPATLKQQGKAIKGRTKTPDGEREWYLEGEISETGYVNGLYYAVDPHDSSVGNFFLYLNLDRRMEGLWSGYEEVNEEIYSGRYSFVPVFDAFTIQPLEAEDIPAVLDIAEQSLGKDYLSVELLQKSLDSDSAYFSRVASVDTDFEDEQSIADRLANALLDQRPKIDDRNVPSDPVDTKVIGFSLGAVFDRDDFRSYLNVSESELSNALRHADKIGVVRTVAVSEGFENRGVGTDLVEDCIDECVSRGATALCAVGREENGRVDIAGVMNHFGFREVGRVEEYWKEESLKGEYHCKNCGAPPCTCTAVIFTRY